MVNSVFDVFHIVVCYWHSNFSKFVDHFLLWVLSSVPNSFVPTVQLLSKCLLSFFAVNLRQLLHLQLVFAHQVLLLLSKISQVSAWRTREDLS
jgi:hypothetical protein